MRLRSFGVNEVIVNVHHYAEKIVDYLKANNNFGMRIEVSREEKLLDAGGGLKKAADFFLDGGEDLREPFILHNVDVLSTIDLRRMARFHAEQGALATLAVQQRVSARQLLFDENGLLCGRRAGQVPGLPGPKCEGPGAPGGVRVGEAGCSGAGAGILRHSCDFSLYLREDGRDRRVFDHCRLSAAGSAGRKDRCLSRG